MKGTHRANKSSNNRNKKRGGTMRHPQYKTEMCKTWLSDGTCPYGPKCQFAHGEHELRKRFGKKTKVCKNMLLFGKCKYGKRCSFIHPPAICPRTTEPEQCAPEERQVAEEMLEEPEGEVEEQDDEEVFEKDEDCLLYTSAAADE